MGTQSISHERASLTRPMPIRLWLARFLAALYARAQSDLAPAALSGHSTQLSAILQWIENGPNVGGLTNAAKRHGGFAA